MFQCQGLDGVQYEYEYCNRTVQYTYQSLYREITVPYLLYQYS